ncbi:hypothetical protein DZF79_28955, partial [Vibrio parahaemolyticus]|nr:hypothetical protein [Vibrio parahaemolyticus]
RSKPKCINGAKRDKGSGGLCQKVDKYLDAKNHIKRDPDQADSVIWVVSGKSYPAHENTATLYATDPWRFKSYEDGVINGVSVTGVETRVTTFERKYYECGFSGVLTLEQASRYASCLSVRKPNR